jgi:molecular chaperone GrpE
MSHPKQKTEEPAKAESGEVAVEPAVEPVENQADAPESPPATQEGPEPVVEPQTAEELQALQEKAAKADSNWDLYLRARAELENYRRRATRERQEAVRYAGQSVVEKLLPVLDSFEKAIEASQQSEAPSSASLLKGVTLVQTQLKSVLAEIGLQEIDAAGQAFDPNLHEAVAHQESEEAADGHVLQQIRKGYKLHDRLVRPATVVVAKAPQA